MADDLNPNQFHINFMASELGLIPEDIQYDIDATTDPNIAYPYFSGFTSSTQSSTSGPKIRRTSKVWEDFDLVEVKAADGSKEWKAQCKRCHTMLTGSSKSWTAHLERHIAMHRKKGAQMASRHDTLSYNPDGTVSNWNYDADFAREGLCRFIASTDTPLCIGEYPVFVDYIKDCHNPRF